jgi:hypothetical protein
MEKRIFIYFILTFVPFQLIFSQDIGKRHEIPMPIPYDSTVAIHSVGDDYIALMSDYLGKNMRYPAIAREKGIQGVVHASYVIDEEGCNTQIKVINDVNPYFAEEVMRLISISPRSIPRRNSKDFKPALALVEAKVHFILKPYSDSIKYEDNITDSVNIKIKIVGYKPIPLAPVCNRCVKSTIRTEYNSARAEERLEPGF